MSQKSTTLTRLARTLNLERLHEISTTNAVTRITAERKLCPWSAGVICLYGLGQFEQELVDDLGVIKLCSALKGRWTEPDDTREFLDPYGE